MARHTKPVRLHLDATDLRAILDGVQPGIDDPLGDLQGVWDDQVGQASAPLKGAVADGLRSIGQDDALQRLVVVESGSPNLGDALGHDEFAHAVGRHGQDEATTVSDLLVEHALVHGKLGIGGADAQGSEAVVLPQSEIADGLDRGPQVEVGEGLVPGERLGSDALDRVRQGDGAGGRPLECVVANLGEPVQVRTQIHLGQGAIVVEGAVGHLHGASQVHTSELGHVPECPLTDLLERAGQGKRSDLGVLERSRLHRA